MATTGVINFAVSIHLNGRGGDTSQLASLGVRTQLRRASRICARVPIDELATFAENVSAQLGTRPSVRAVFTDKTSFEETVESLDGLRKAGPFDRPFKRPVMEPKIARALRCELRLVGENGSVHVDIGTQPGVRGSVTSITVRHSDPHSAELLLRDARALLHRHRPIVVYIGLVNAALWGLVVANWLVSPPPPGSFTAITADAEGNLTGSPSAWITACVQLISLFWAMDIVFATRWASTVTVPAGQQANARPSRWNPSPESVRRWAVIAGLVGILALAVGAASLYVQLTGVKLEY